MPELSDLLAPPEPSFLSVPFDRIEPPAATAIRGRAGQSIHRLGFVSTLLLRRLNTPAPDGYGWAFEVVDGARRYRDAEREGLTELPALVLPPETSRTQVAALSAALNLARSPNPLAEAEAFAQLVRAGMDDEQIAADLGVPLGTVRKRLRLASAPPEVLEAVRSGACAAGTAAAVANLAGAYQAACVRRLEASGKLRASDVRDVQRARKEAALDALPGALFAEVAVAEVASRPASPDAPSGHAAAVQDETPEEALARVALEAARSGMTHRALRDVVQSAFQAARAELA